MCAGRRLGIATLVDRAGAVGEAAMRLKLKECKLWGFCGTIVEMMKKMGLLQALM